MNKFPILISGPPGSGKTTKFIESIARGTTSTVWVLEPVQKIVNEKTENLQLVEDGVIINNNIEYINYAAALIDNFYLHTFKENDIMIIDEAHLLFFTEYRRFQIKSVKEILELFPKTVFISATPEILEIYLKGNHIEYFKQEFEQRLERKKIVVNFIPTKFFKFLNQERLKNYDIIISDNIKNLKKLEEEIKDDFSLIYSYYNENNNLFFPRRTIKDNQWLGTCAMGQGIDKFKTLIPGKAKVLFDGNTFKRVPDSAAAFYKNNFNIDYYKVMFKCLVESMIQTDRFRVDLEILEIDLLLDLELDNIEILKKEIISYFGNVYRKSRVEFNIGDGLYAEKERKFTINEFRECLNNYDIDHVNNKKSHGARFIELSEDWCDPVKGDDRIRKIGHYKSTIEYFRELYIRFYQDTNFEEVFLKHASKDQLLAVQNAISNLIEFFFDFDLKTKIYEYLKNEKEREPGEIVDLETEFYTHLSYIGEALLQILFFHYGIQYNVMSQEKREGNPIQLLPKYLRYFMLVKDIDVSGCHVIALIKKIMGDNFEITPDLISKIYSYGNLSREEVLGYLQTFKKLKDLSLDEIEALYKTERNICKQAILGGMNRLKYKKDRDYEIVQKMIANGIPSFKFIDLKKYGEVGYYNGIIYEQKWLGGYNGHKGVIYRIADGLGQIYGNPEILEDIKFKIMEEHKIIVSDEDIQKYKVFDTDKNLEYFVQEAYRNRPDEITKEDIFKSFIRCLDSLEKFRKYIRKGATKGKAKGKLQKVKQYEVKRDFTVKNTNISYKKGIYEWRSIPMEIPVNYRKRLIRMIKNKI